MDTNESRNLATRLAHLLRNEQHAMADFLVALADFDRRRCWIELGYSGLFPFLHRELGLSKAAAFFRKAAAELIQRYPELVEPLRDGRICLTTVASLAKVITPENRAEVMPRFFHRSGLEAKAIVAKLAPVADPPTRTVITTTSARTVTAGPESPSKEGFADEPCGLDQSTTDRSEPLLREPPPRLRTEPLTATLTRLHVTVSPAFLQKLEAARLSLSHSLPGASEEDILSAGLDLLLERDAKRKALVKKPRPAPASTPTPGADHIPAAVRREVWKRDHGECQWPVEGGGICGSRLRVQLDHIRLKCRGAPPIASELRVLCAFHNELSARLALGDEIMDRYTQDPRQPA